MGWKFVYMTVKKYSYPVILGIIFIFAFCVRLYHFDITQPIVADEGMYHYGAANLIEHSIYTYDYFGEQYNGNQPLVSSCVIMPGYVLFLAGLYKLFGVSVELARCSSLAISMIMLYFIYKILKEISCSKVVICITLVLVSVYPGFIYNNQRILTENLFTLLLLGMVYFYLRFLDSSIIRYLVISGVLFGCSFMVRTVAILPAIIIVISLLLDNSLLKRKFYEVVIFLSPVFILSMVWILRNYLSLGEIVFSEAGHGPVIWGLVPYFMDILNLPSDDVYEIFVHMYNLSPELFLKWKIFGHLQYMWWDVWDEFLVHPSICLKWLGVIHYFLIIFYFAFVPKLIKKCSVKYYCIICMPIIFSLFYLIFHGIPRYVWPSVPFMFIVFAMGMDSFFYRAYGNHKKYFYDYSGRLVRMYKSLTYILSVIMGILIFYSVFCFSATNSYEMSKYNLLSNGQIDIGEVENNPVVFDKLILPDDESLQYITPSVVEMRNMALGKNNVVSKIEIRGKGGFLYDRCIIYWKNSYDVEYSDSKVITFPTYKFQNRRIVYIYDDINEILLYPIVFYGGEFEFDSLQITKFYCGK